MKIAIISDQLLKNELLAQGQVETTQIEWVEHLSDVSKADCYIDLLFDFSPDRINNLQRLQPGIVIVNAVNTTMNELPAEFIRINGWRTFLSMPIIEAVCLIENLNEIVEAVFASFNKNIQWTPDIPGFISPRVISMIINEAYFTLEDKVTGKEEIDIAMKLGTKYPYGPFEWCQKIGVRNIYELLLNLSTEHNRYKPCELLKQEAFQ